MRHVTVRVFGALLRLYPSDFRDRFGTDLRSALQDRLDVLWARRAAARLLPLARLAADIVVAALRERARPTVRAPILAGAPAASRGDLVSTLLQDLLFGARSLLRRPLFAGVGALTLAIGIGSSTAVFTVVDGVLLEPLPLPEPERLVMLWSFDRERGPVADGLVRGWMSQPDVESVRELGGLSAVEGVTPGSADLTGTDRPERISVSRSTGGLLTLLGVTPHMGRDLRHEDDHPDAPRVVVVSHGFWQDRMGATPGAVGSTIELNELRWEVVGVAPASFDYPPGVELWQPFRNGPNRDCRGCQVFNGALVRLGDGISFEAASAAVEALASGLGEAYPDSNLDKGLYLERLLDYHVGDVRRGLWIVLGAVGLVLLIVCANMANLLLVRAADRAREVALRSALGASRGRLFRQVITESLVLAGAGGALGFGLSQLLLGGIRALASGRVPRMGDVATDGTAFVFLVLVTGLVAALFGLSPALHLSRRRGAEHLLGGARGGAGGGARARALLLAVEVAFSILLLAGAGLLLRSLDRLYAVDLGFDGEHVTRFSLSLPGTRYPDLTTIGSFYRQLEERLQAEPDVARVGSVFGAPFGWWRPVGYGPGRGSAEPRPR